MYVKVLLNISMNSAWSSKCNVKRVFLSYFIHSLLGFSGTGVCIMCVCNSVCAVHIYIARTALVGGVSSNFVMRLNDWLGSLPLPLLIDWRGIIRIASLGKVGKFY